ncbi:MAG: MoxR family ATPase [Nitrososphaerota archaeon]|nr:MoxR family ATPase [Nitrososphaerota archaeon]
MTETRADIKKEEITQDILNELSKVIIGKREVLESLLIAILSDGNVLIEDYPGLAKTLMARSIAQTLGCVFKRIQFTPDLLPADITGTYILNRKTSDFELRKGPIFTNILLADEINRAPPRTQSALLEAMQERQVTIENESIKLERPFLVIATQNPIEYEGTYPLPEAQLDRFIMKLDVGYPDADQEVAILEARDARKADEFAVKKLADSMTLIRLQRSVEESVHVDKAVFKYMVEIVRETRFHKSVQVGSSPRGGLALLKLSKARAWLSGRSYVLPDDVKGVAISALSHRLILQPEQWISGGKTSKVISEILGKVPVPKVD